MNTGRVTVMSNGGGQQVWTAELPSFKGWGKGEQFVMASNGCGGKATLRLLKGIPDAITWSDSFANTKMTVWGWWNFAVGDQVTARMDISAEMVAGHGGFVMRESMTLIPEGSTGVLLSKKAGWNEHDWTAAFVQPNGNVMVVNVRSAWLLPR